MKKKLHELIEMAESGKQFEAIHPGSKQVFCVKEFKTVRSWNGVSITGDWEVRMKREPRVLYVSEDRLEKFACDDIYYISKAEEPEGKPIKFVEVIEGEE
ncbi:MAG TPA: hypothetical protein DCE71_07885 [Parachlamydiales bacterium]|nr:hypothetical protein [Parachlamydiales bacterium]